MRKFSLRKAAWLLGIGLSVSPRAARAAPSVGSTMPPLSLSGEAGGRVDGSPWSSSMLKDKVWMIFYIAPGHRDDNQELKDALHAADFPPAQFGTVAVINMAASWLPNSVLNSALKSNQEKYPKVVYVKDTDKALVKQWHLADDAFAALLLDKQGQVLMVKDGDFSKADIDATIALIKKSTTSP